MDISTDSKYKERQLTFDLHVEFDLTEGNDFCDDSVYFAGLKFSLMW